MAWNKLSGKKIKKIIEKSSDAADIYLVEYVDKTTAYISKTDIVKKNPKLYMRSH